MNSMFAFLHHIAAFTLISAMIVELVLIREAISVSIARKLQIADAVFGASAGVILVVGLLRVFYFEKGAAYYFSNGPFLVKLALFAVIGGLSIGPTREFLSWRAATKAGRAPSVDGGRLQKLRAAIHMEVAAAVFLVLCAALMARGVGGF